MLVILDHRTEKRSDMGSNSWIGQSYSTVHARLALCSPPPPAFIIASVDAFVDGRGPLSLPIATHCRLGLIASRCLSLLLFHWWLVVVSLPASLFSVRFIVRCPIPSSPAVMWALTLSLLAATPFHGPSPATDACLGRSPVNCWLLHPPSSALCYPPPTSVIVY